MTPFLCRYVAIMNLTLYIHCIILGFVGVKTREGFHCFVAIVRVRVYVDFLFSLFYATGECYRFLPPR